VLDGEKTFITGIDQADHVLMVARTRSRDEVESGNLPKTSCLSVFVVDRHAPGLSLTRLPMRAIEGAHQWTVHFDGVKVPVESRAGDEDASAYVMINALKPGRVLIAAGAVGQTERLLDMAVAYASQRVVFGARPIGAYQAVQHPLADVRIRLESARGLTYKA